MFAELRIGGIHLIQILSSKYLRALLFLCIASVSSDLEKQSPIPLHSLSYIRVSINKDFLNPRI